MTTFDGSTQRTEARSLPTEYTESADSAIPSFDTLDLLRDQVAARQASADESEPTVVEVPGGTIRLHCSNDISSDQINRWNSKALPPKLRKTINVSPLAVNQFVLNSSILIDTCQQVDVKNPKSEQWIPIEDSSGNVLGFKDKPLLQALGVIDPAAAIRKLFPRDPDLIHAGQRVLQEAGWGDDQDGDLEDPS